MTSKRRRIVIKIGTSVLTKSRAAGNKREFEVRPDSPLGGLVREIAGLAKRGAEVVLVTSGAIGAGAAKLGWSKRPDEIRRKQAAAAVGQVSLMRAYERLFEADGVHVAQVLLTRSDFEDRRRYLNARNTLLTLLELGAVPVINENDTVAVEEIQFGDNDRLSALVAAKTDADLLVILSDVDGLLKKEGGREEVVPLVPEITPEIEKLVWSGKSEVGTGGMASKLEAAKIATASGVAVVIASAFKPGVLTDLFEGRDAGTKFLSLKALTAKERWLLFGAAPKGELIVDDGAARALKEQKRSLLPAGVAEVRGLFRKGEVVRIRARDGGEFARGIVSFSSQDIDKIKGHRTGELRRLLEDHTGSSEVVHRDSLALLP